MQVLFLVDLHGRPPHLSRLEGVDLLLLGGDLTHFGHLQQAAEILRPLRQRCQVLAVAGNCDDPQIQHYLEAEGLALEGHSRILEGVQLLGLSAGLPFGDCPFERGEEEFAYHLQSLKVSGKTILVSHQPPRGSVCDRTRTGNVGSLSVRQWVEAHQPELVLCGHIHEGKGQEKIGQTTVWNPGPSFQGGGVRFRLEAGQILDLRQEPKAGL